MTCGLIGRRLGHSYSPQIHRALADYDYKLWELEPEELETFFRRQDFTGVNVTIPYKQAVIPLLDELSETARAIGAVNTVVRRDGKLCGDNTDFAGMAALIRHIMLSLEGKKVLILGTGGTSKTAVAVARSLGAAEVYRLSRSGRDGALTYEDAARLHADADVLINTTPGGMYPAVEGCPVALDAFPNLSGVVDAVYNPLRTNLVLQARSRGIPAEGGLYMLAAQAAYEKSSEKTDFSKKMDSVWEYLKKLFRLSLDTKFIATRRDAIILNIPILIPIIALFAWGATIWLMLIGLFFGMRYRIDSDGDVPGSINNLMNHAADAADDIKQNLNDDK